MDATGYTTLTRQAGLLREMDLIANNIANMSTTGYRREGLVFSEYVQRMEAGTDSLSMAHANVRAFNSDQGQLKQTNGTFDFAIEGDGFFMVQTPGGQFLTRAGSFTPNADGELVAPDGAFLLDGGGAPVFVPPDATSVALASDGTLSADGQPIGEIGLYMPLDPNDMRRAEGTRFDAGDVVAADNAAVLQGFLEGSNVSPIFEIARMIEVQRSYELGQSFLDKEDERVRNALELMRR
ncbi:MAG: flagellar hook-basal body complex protein [Pseudomonadota bacterium]